MLESELSRPFMAALNKVGHAQRVENAAQTGSPDIEYVIERAKGHVETKICHSGWLYFERFQLPWMRRRLRVTGGTGVWILAANAGTAFLFPARVVLDVRREPYRKWTRVSWGGLSGLDSCSITRPWRWGPVIDILRNEQPIYGGVENE